MLDPDISYCTNIVAYLNGAAPIDIKKYYKPGGRPVKEYRIKREISQDWAFLIYKCLNNAKSAK